MYYGILRMVPGVTFLIILFRRLRVPFRNCGGIVYAITCNVFNSESLEYMLPLLKLRVAAQAWHLDLVVHPTSVMSRPEFIRSPERLQEYITRIKGPEPKGNAFNETAPINEIQTYQLPTSHRGMQSMIIYRRNNPAVAKRAHSWIPQCLLRPRSLVVHFRCFQHCPKSLLVKPRNAMDIKVQKYNCQGDVSLILSGRGSPRFGRASAACAPVPWL